MPNDFLVLIIFSSIFGAALGSFLNVCIYRLPREESIAFPPSHCTSCNSPIKFYHNVPVLSYLALRGRCRTCSAGISPVYPVVELLTGAVCALLVWKFGFTVQTLFYIVFLSALIVVTFIDLEHRIIPNVITFPGIIVGLIYGTVRTDWAFLGEAVGYIGFDFWTALQVLITVPVIDSLLGVILGGGILFLTAFLYEVIRKREGMGMGDVKLLAMIGAFLGWKSVIFVIFLSSIIGTVVGISIILYKKGDLKYAIPYGPFLSFAAAVHCFTGGFDGLAF